MDKLTICKHAKEHPAIFLFAITLLFLPVIAAAIQALPFPKFIPMSVGECVGYYGTAGAVVWAICAFAVQKRDHEREVELEYKPSLELMIIESDEKSALKMKLVNAGLHGVRSVRLEGNVVSSYIASEDAVLIEVLPDPDNRALRLNRGLKKGLLQNLLSDIDFCEEAFPRELSVLVNDLRGERWRTVFRFERQAAFANYMAQEPEKDDH